MERRDGLAKGLALVGTGLAWLPIAATVALSAVVTLRSGRFRLDYLMPAELFPAALLGGILLLIAALRTRSHRAPIAWSLGLMVFMLVAGQGLAVVTGLASGAAEPEGWRLALVAGLLVAYVVALVALDISAVRLVRDLFAKPADAAASGSGDAGEDGTV